MMFGEYFPNPGMVGVDEGARALITPLGAAAVEALGTGILVLMIFALVDRRNSSLPVKYLAPVFIGLTVAMIISMLAPLTMGGWNPARDFGPRLVSYFAGWGEVAIPGPSGGFWAYIVGPLVGGPLALPSTNSSSVPHFPPANPTPDPPHHVETISKRPSHHRTDLMNGRFSGFPPARE